MFSLDLNKEHKTEPGMMEHAFNSSTKEAEAGGSLRVRPTWSTKRVPGGYTEKPCLEQTSKKQQQHTHKLLTIMKNAKVHSN